MNDKKIKVGAVSYLNTKPLIYGFQSGMLQNEIDLIFDYPANIAHQLLNNQIDIGLVPVAVLPSMKEYYFVSDYCIASIGAVASVCLFSDVPLAEIKTIYLDYQSKTSVALLKILLQQFWKISPKLIDGEKDFENKIVDTSAGLVIGDRAFKQGLKSKYAYDLGEAWNKLTGLPFVFATWVSNKKLPENFIKVFNEATAVGLQNIDTIVNNNKIDDYDLKQYYTKNINYQLDENKKKGLQSFLKKLSLL